MSRGRLKVADLNAEACMFGSAKQLLKEVSATKLMQHSVSFGFCSISTALKALKTDIKMRYHVLFLPYGVPDIFECILSKTSK